VVKISLYFPIFHPASAYSVRNILVLFFYLLVGGFGTLIYCLWRHAHLFRPGLALRLTRPSHSGRASRATGGARLRLTFAPQAINRGRNERIRGKKNKE
jgi:hypothetical protein